MMLWTWQSPDFDPFTDRVDRSRSDFTNLPPHADLLRAYEELDARLTVSAEVKHQYLWCFTTDSWEIHPWDRVLWPIDVPEESILSFVDGPLWARLIGNQTVPTGITELW